MSQDTPVKKSQVGPIPSYINKSRDFPVPFKHQPKEDVSQEDILQYKNYILKELDDLEKNFDKIFSDILLLK